MLRLAALLTLALAAACADAQARADACQALVPRSLSDALARAYPGYRTPLETDNAPQDIDHDRARGGSGCLGVALGDFTGAGKKEYLVGLSAVKGRSGLAVLALPRAGGWHFEKLRSGVESARFRQRVAALEPGPYSAAASDAQAAAGELRRIDCPNQAAFAGAVDASGSVYCRSGGRWQHLFGVTLP